MVLRPVVQSPSSLLLFLIWLPVYMSESLENWTTCPANINSYYSKVLWHFIVFLSYCFFPGEFEGEYKPIAEFPDPKLGSLNVSSHPTSPLITCSGRARDWPESRGIFRNKDNTFVVFVNEDDHVQFRCFDKGGNLQNVFDKLVRGMAAFERELKKSGEEFIWDDHLGYIVSDPIYLGTALEVRVRVKLHHLSTVSRQLQVLLVPTW